MKVIDAEQTSDPANTGPDRLGPGLGIQYSDRPGSSYVTYRGINFYKKSRCFLLNMSLNFLISNYFRCNWSFVFDPAGRLCYYWSMVVSFAFLYNFWVIIFRFSFAEITLDTLLIWFCLDYLMDLIYLLDIVFHFRTGYLEDGVLQTDSTKLRQHYMNSTTFYVDCLCLLPLDFLYLSLGFKSILRIFR